MSQNCMGLETKSLKIGKLTRCVAGKKWLCETFVAPEYTTYLLAVKEVFSKASAVAFIYSVKETLCSTMRSMFCAKHSIKVKKA